MKTAEHIIETVDKLVRKYHTRDPYELCQLLGIKIHYYDLQKKLKGFFYYQSRQKNIVIDHNVNGILERILVAHELGHAVLHTKIAMMHGFQEMEVFDDRYNELGVVVRDCNKALNDILVIMLQAEKYVALLAKSLSEYESVQLGSTNGISASTPQTSSFAVTPSSADTTTFESNTFGSNLAFVQDRLSAERYFSRGNHYEEYRDYWENGNYTFSRNENPELVYVRARDIEGVYLSDRELGNPEGFWTRNGREGWSRENILRRASHIQDVRQNTESGMSLDELSQNPVLDDTIRSYYNNPVQVAQVGSYYVFQSDGRHRTLAAQSLDTYIPVLVTGSYTRND